MENLKYLILIVVVIIIGFFLYQSFFEFSLAMISDDKIEFFSNDITSRFSSQLIFSLVIGFIPILYLIIQKISKISFWFDGAYVLLIMIVFGSLTTILRGVFICQEIMILSSIKLPNNGKLSYSIDRLYFEYFLFFGFMIGALICMMLLRLKKINDKV